MTQHVVRVKWKNGYVEVSDGGTGRRKTIPFDAGNADTLAAATAVGQAVLTQYGYTPRRSVVAEVVDTAAWPGIGDSIRTAANLDGNATAQQRLVSRRVEIQAKGGFARLVPTMNTEADELVTRQQLAIKRLTNGTVGGRSAGAYPFQQDRKGALTGQMSPPSLETWSFDPLDTKDGQIIKITEPMVLTKATSTFTIGKTPATLPHDVIFWIMQNGVLLTYTQHLAGHSTWEILGQVVLSPNDKFQVCVQSVTSNTLADLDGVSCAFQFTTAPSQLNREPASGA